MGLLFTGIDAWLNTEPNLPKELQEAIRHNGLLETVGKGNNVNIMSWAKLLKVIGWYASDLVPWCALFVAICAFRAGKLKLPAPKLLSAKWWLTQGDVIEIEDACVGDRAIKERDGGHHIFYIIGENDTQFRGYGGNQSNKVCPAWFLKSEIIGVRRAKWLVSQPLGVKKRYYKNLNGAVTKVAES